MKFTTRGYVTLLAKKVSGDLNDVEDRLEYLHRLALAVVHFCWMPTNVDDVKKAASLSEFPYCTCFQCINNVLLNWDLCANVLKLLTKQ